MTGGGEVSALQDRWWVLHHDDLMTMLRLAHDGIDPSMLMTAYYVNALHEQVDVDG